MKYYQVGNIIPEDSSKFSGQIEFWFVPAVGDSSIFPPYKRGVLDHVWVKTHVIEAAKKRVGRGKAFIEEVTGMKCLGLKKE